jgi:hypothetical protein
VINDPTAMNLFFVNLDGVPLIQIDERIAAPRLKMTDRVGHWATFEVGQERTQRHRGGRAPGL